MSDQSPPVQVSAVFPYQSYFDNTLLDTAVQLQGAGRSILDNAATPAKDSDVGGYGVALDPSSETPIAISFKSKQGSGTSAAVILRPGQSVFPFGRGADDAFSGFRWGLPLGWLGGGLVTLTVLQSPRAEMEWAGLRRQMIFHRMTLPILAKGATIIATNISPNWPLRFPSIGTRRTSQSGIVSQALAPVLAVEPTLTLVRLVTTTGVITIPPTVRFLFYATKEFDLNGANAFASTPVGFEDEGFPSVAQLGAGGAPQCPVLTLTSGLLAAIGIDSPSGGTTGMGVVAIDRGDGDDVSTAGAAGGYIQVVRYGRL